MSPRTLILMRHGKSDWSGEHADIDRPLSKRGRLQAAEAGHWLQRNHPSLELVITSPAMRARSTWDRARTQYDANPFLAVDERAYTFEHPGLVTVLRDVDKDIASLLLIGHEPALTDLITLLTGTEVDMVTSALAVLDFDGGWKKLGARTCNLLAHGRPPE